MNNKIICVLIFVLINNIINAQLKVGKNSLILSPNINLQIESENNTQFVVTKDSSKVGIGTLIPDAALDVRGKVKIVDGTQAKGKILTSDDSGKATWAYPSSLSIPIIDSTNASNGLSLNGKTVELGGVLNKSTVIATSSTNTIALTGLQSGNTISDSILIVDINGVIKRVSANRITSSYSNNISGSVIRTLVFNENDFSLSLYNAGASETTFITYNYTPLSANSNIIVEFYVRYNIDGWSSPNDDIFYSYLKANGSSMQQNLQRFLYNSGNIGGGTRSGTLFPIVGKYNNSSLSPINFSVSAVRASGDDNVNLSNDFVLKITEINK